MALDPVSVGAALALTDGAATKASQAAQAANEAAGRANEAAEGAENYASQWDAYSRAEKMEDADIRLLYSQFQAHVRSLEKRITTLEGQVSALAGK